MSDGTNLGIDADRALKTILGGEPSPGEDEPERVEMALAYGHSHAHIRRTLGVDQDEITAAIDRIETAAADPDGDCPACGGYFARIRMHLATNETCRAAVADDPPFMLAGAG